jgi:hypothetical protein
MTVVAAAAVAVAVAVAGLWLRVEGQFHEYFQCLILPKNGKVKVHNILPKAGKSQTVVLSASDHCYYYRVF